MLMKNCNENIGNRTRDLPACSAVPQPTAPPRAPFLCKGKVKLSAPSTQCRHIKGEELQLHSFLTSALVRGECRRQQFVGSASSHCTDWATSAAYWCAGSALVNNNNDRVAFREIQFREMWRFSLSSTWSVLYRLSLSLDGQPLLSCNYVTNAHARYCCL
jgi:hypothetical protein